jgi:hypothetical protein
MKPESQIRFTSGFTSTLTAASPCAETPSRITNRSSPVSSELRIAGSFVFCPSAG